MPVISLKAHFDGRAIQLDEAVELPCDARLLVTVLDPVLLNETAKPERLSRARRANNEAWIQKTRVFAEEVVADDEPRLLVQRGTERRLTAVEYLAIERKAEFRSEYLDGSMFAMQESSREHSLIRGNFCGELAKQLKDRTDEVYTANMRVRVPSGLYTYPDVVVCDAPKFDDDHVDTLLNPLVLIEVLSESTADYDRGTKFKHYRQIKSLREYVLVDQEAAQIEHFVFGDDGKWSLTELVGLDQVLKLNSIECQIPLSEIYRKVTFKEADSGELP